LDPTIYSSIYSLRRILDQLRTIFRGIRKIDNRETRSRELFEMMNVKMKYLKILTALRKYIQSIRGDVAFNSLIERIMDYGSLDDDTVDSYQR
jgi:hypothetical protein